MHLGGDCADGHEDVVAMGRDRRGKERGRWDCWKDAWWWVFRHVVGGRGMTL